MQNPRYNDYEIVKIIDFSIRNTKCSQSINLSRLLRVITLKIMYDSSV